MKALLLGAGASYELGLQLVWELTRQLKDYLIPEKLDQLNEGWQAHGGGYSDDVISLIKDLLGVDSMQYENVIGALDVEINRERNAERHQELNDIRCMLLEVIHYLLYCWQVNIAYIEPAIKDLYGIKKLVEESNPMWVFSLNHDVNLEIIAAEYDIPVKSGFNEIVALPARSEEGNIIGEIEFEYLSREDMENNKYDFFNTGEYGINLVKMHGSLDIFAQGDELNYLKIRPKSLNCVTYITELKKVNEQLRDHPFVKIANEIAYSRALLAGAYKSNEQFVDLFKLNMKYVDEIICIGYGFGDSHINEAIEDWLSFSNERNLEIVNPSIDDVPASLANLCRQVSIKKIGCIDYFLSIDSSKDSTPNSFGRDIRGCLRNKLRQRIENGT